MKISENQKEDNDTTTDDEKSTDLLFPPSDKLAQGSKKKFLQKLHDNIARTPIPGKDTHPTQNVTTKKKTKKQEPIPEILQIPDKKLRDHVYAMEAIEQKILRKRQNDVSVQDLAWYIANTKPRFGHMKAQLTQECGVIQRDAAKVFKKATKDAVDFAEMELAKQATIECNKLNNTSFKIMQEIKKAQETGSNLEEIHATCSNLMGPMSVWATQFLTKTELDHQVEKINKDIATRMDHTEQLLHPLRNAIEAMEQGITPLRQEIHSIKATVPRSTTNPTDTTNAPENQTMLELKQYMKEQEARIERQRMEIKNLQRDIQDQNTMIRNVYATKLEYESHRQQLQELQKSVERKPPEEMERESTDLVTLKQQVQDIKTKLGNLATPRNPLFPDVDPTTISTPKPTPTSSSIPLRTNTGTTHLRPPIPPSNSNIHRSAIPQHHEHQTINDIYPYGSHVTAHVAGKSVDCWIQRCITSDKGLEYEASMSGGETIRIKHEEVVARDPTSTPTKVPDNYIVHMSEGTHHRTVSMPGGTQNSSVRSSGRYDQPYEPIPPRYEHSDGEDHSDNSDHNIYDRRRHTTRRQAKVQQYANNAFVYPRGGIPQYIREDKAASVGKTFTGNLAADEDPREFYRDVRQTVMVQKVLLRAYDSITKTSGLLEIDPYNCENYINARTVMSRFLFIFFFHGRDIMFDANSYAKNSLINYETEQNGLSFLEDLIRDSHPELRTEVHRSSITDAFTLPTFAADISLWQYINQMQIHFKEVNKSTPQIDILRLIHDQLKIDPRFKTASEHLQDNISKYKSGNGFVPPEYRLNKIARTIMDQYSLSERQKLSEPRQKTVRALELNVSRMSTRSTSPKPYRPSTAAPVENTDQQLYRKPLSEYGADTAPKTKDKQVVRFQKQPPNNKICKGCFTYGHDVEECTKTGAAISIAQFLRTCGPEKKQQILAAYKQNRKDAHDRYVAAYQRRRQLKQQIKRIEYDMQFNENNQTWKDLSASELQHLDHMRIACVVEAKKEHPDIDFGSLDTNYEDLTEPRLEFDPDTDSLPVSE